MRTDTLLLASFLSLASLSASRAATTNYWDSNGPNPGAGATPDGNWDADLYWSASAAGTSPTVGWTDGSVAIFSAGNDAVNPYTVTINGSVQSGGLIFKSGQPTITGGSITMTNEFEFPIVVTNDTWIDSGLQDSYATCGIRKTGPGVLTLAGANFFGAAGCTNIVAEGVLSAAGSVALGSGSITIVSNGATLRIATSQSVGYPVILNGNGLTNSGALHGTSGSPWWSGGAQLDSDTRIVWDGGGQWNWNGTYTNIYGAAGNYDLTIAGHGGTVRLNMAAYAGNRAVNLGTGKLIKEGTCTLQFENGTICSGFYLNGGGVYPRNITTIGQGSIYVSGTNSGFYSLFQDCTIATPISLTAGARLWFNAQNYQGNVLTFTCSSVMSGPGGVSIRNAGRAIFTAANTYTGPTIIESNSPSGLAAGTLALTGNGSIAGSSLIDVQTGATLDVAGVTGGFVLGSQQTLQGGGTVVGNVQAAGTLAPGDSVGTLAFNDGLSLAAGVKVLIDIDKSAAPVNDLISVGGTLSSAGSGMVVVTTLGPAPVLAGETYQIFSQPVPNGNSLSVVSAGGDVVWANNLQSNGSITVVKAAPTLAAAAWAGPNSLTLSGAGGPNLNYNVYAYTNVAAPLVNWWQIGTAHADSNGAITFVDTQATNRQRFYRLNQ